MSRSGDFTPEDVQVVSLAFSMSFAITDLLTLLTSSLRILLSLLPGSRLRRESAIRLAWPGLPGGR
jgi:hypothetical protein